MGIDFYYSLPSAPCRSVIMTAKALNIDLNLIETNIMGGDHLKPEFIKLNPQHTIPTINDNGFSLWESRAIIIYLVEKYASPSKAYLYPKEPKQRAIVNQRLFFDMGTLFQRWYDYFVPQFLQKLPADPEKFKKMEEAVELLNKFLEANEWVAGDKMTVADIALVSSVSTYEAGGFDLTNYPNVARWLEHCKKVVPGYEENQKGIDLMKGFFHKLGPEITPAK